MGSHLDRLEKYQFLLILTYREMQWFHSNYHATARSDPHMKFLV